MTPASVRTHRRMPVLPVHRTRVWASWNEWGIMRHPGYLRARDVADAVVQVVSTPRGTHLTLVEVEPEAPVEDR